MPVTLNSVLQVLLFLVIVLLLTKPVGLYMYKIFNGERTWLSPVFVPVERLFYRLSGVNPEEEQTWVGYMISVLIFSLVGMLLLYAFERTQQWHGTLFNPAGLPNVEPQLAFNTAASFTTNTNWQNYTGEQTMSYLTQMAGLAFHQFVSAAAGIAMAVALVRGLARRSAQHLGNFWIDSAILFVIGLLVIIRAEQIGNPLLTKVGVNQVVSDTQSGGNMEGKEVRYGITISALQEETTTATSTGTVMSFHDSYTPLGGLVLITNMALGEIIFGGVGAGLYSMLMFAIIVVFIAGLM